MSGAKLQSEEGIKVGSQDTPKQGDSSPNIRDQRVSRGGASWGDGTGSGAGFKFPGLAQPHKVAGEEGIGVSIHFLSSVCQGLGGALPQREPWSRTERLPLQTKDNIECTME